MIAILSVLVIVTLSILVTRVGTLALVHTGLTRDVARFQARSAFTGVGFTTHESEQITRHPVRRRIAMILMFLGNAGIVTVISSLILGFVERNDSGPSRVTRLTVLLTGLSVLWALASSRWVDRWLSRIIDVALDRWTDLDIRDYAQLLRLSGEYGVRELNVDPDDWLAGRSLGELQLREEGVNVLGIERSDASYVGVPRGDTVVEPGDVLILYGRREGLRSLDERGRDARGDQEHDEAVEEQARQDRAQADRERRRSREGRPTPR